MPLTDGELAELEKFGRLPGTVLGPSARTSDRNRRLVESILEQPQAWPVLVFAASVAARADPRGPAREGGPHGRERVRRDQPTVRRYIVDRFKAGDIQVLTNYGVLTQGFDAPGDPRALHRPADVLGEPLPADGRTRAPRRAQRWQGQCLVVNVADNLERYGHELAFREFDYLWTS